MRSTVHTVLSATTLLCLFAAQPAEAQERSPEAQPAESEASLEVDGTDVSDMSKIEDASLEGLLDLDLEDRLGQTEAVSRTNESILRAPASMTTLTAAQIRRSGATTVPDVLRSVPGVAVFRNTPGNYVVSLRGTGGLAGNNVILLVDGIPINNPLDGNIDWSLVPLDVEDIERIEVVRGPVSPTYGANAYTGVINVVTRTSMGLSPDYAARVRAGADLDGGRAGAASGRFLHLGKRVELKWFLNAEHDDLSAAPATPTRSLRDRRPAANRVSMLTSLTLRPTRASSLHAEAGQVWSARSGMDHLALDSERQTQRMLFGRVEYSTQSLVPVLSDMKVWAQAISLRVRAGHDMRTGFSYDGAESLRGVAGTDLVIPLSAWASAQLGGQASLERMSGPFLHPRVSGEVRPAYGFYAGLKAAPLPSLDLIATARGDIAPISADLEYSYRASAVYHTDSWGLRLTGASAFRAPTYVEATGRFLDAGSGLILLEGADSIGAPRNTSVELGATFSPHSRLIIAPTVYVSRLSNLMIEDFESVLRRTFRNDPEPRSYLGAEIEATWRVNDWLSVLPSFTVLEWIDAAERLDTNVGVPSQNSTYIAALRLHGSLGNETWGYGLAASVASERQYNVRSGIPPVVLTTQLPTSARISAMLERQLAQAPSLWASMRLGASLPGDAAESPLPLAGPGGQSIIFGVEMRRD